MPNLDLLCILWHRAGNGSLGCLMCRKQQVPTGVRDEQNSLLFPLCRKCHVANSCFIFWLSLSGASCLGVQLWHMRDELTPLTWLRGAGSTELHPEVTEAGSTSQTVPVWPAERFCSQEQRGALIICQA